MKKIKTTPLADLTKLKILLRHNRHHLRESEYNIMRNLTNKLMRNYKNSTKNK